MSPALLELAFQWEGLTVNVGETINVKENTAGQTEREELVSVRGQVAPLKRAILSRTFWK